MDNNIENNPQTNNTVIPSGGIKKWQINSLLALIIILIIILGFILYLLAFKKTPSSNTTSSKTSVTNNKPKVNATTNPYKGWLTYTNNTYGYSFKYPPSWIVNSNNSTITVTSPNGYKFQYSEISSPFASGGAQIVGKSSSIKIDNAHFYKYYLNTQTKGCSTQIGFQYEIIPNACVNSFSEIELGTTIPTSVKDQNGKVFNNINAPTFINSNNHFIFINFILPNATTINSSSFSIMNQNLNLTLKSIKF
jgi:hypothetical protein